MPESAPCGLYRQLKNTAPQQGGVFLLSLFICLKCCAGQGEDTLSGHHLTTREPETTGFVSKTG